MTIVLMMIVMMMTTTTKMTMMIITTKTTTTMIMVLCDSDSGKKNDAAAVVKPRNSSSNPQRCCNKPAVTMKIKDDSCSLVADCLFVGCITSQQHASVSQGRICSDNFTCCHTEIEVADQTFYLTQSQYTDTRPTSPSTDNITPSAWQGSHWSANFEVTGMTRAQKNLGPSGIQTLDLPMMMMMTTTMITITSSY